MKKLILLFISLLIGLISYSQIITKIDSIVSCENNIIVVPITVDSLYNVYAISLVLKYDQTKLTYIGYQNLNTNLAGILIYNSTINNPYEVRMAWYSPFYPMNTIHDTLLKLKFQYNDINPAFLNWDTITSNYSDDIGNKYPTIFQNGLIYQSNIKGNIKYDNITQTPINNVKVYIKKNSILIDSTITDINGDFNFYCLNDDTYDISFSKYGNWSGVNSLDALLIAQDFVGYQPIQNNFRRKSGDVNDDTILNATDALLIMKRFTNIISSFKLGDWIFDLNNTQISSNATINVKGLCVGDVNGSY